MTEKSTLNLYINTTAICGAMSGYALVVAESQNEAGVIYDFARREYYEQNEAYSLSPSYEEYVEFADSNADISKDENWERLIEDVKADKGILRDSWHYV